MALPPSAAFSASKDIKVRGRSAIGLPPTTSNIIATREDVAAAMKIVRPGKSGKSFPSSGNRGPLAPIGFSDGGCATVVMIDPFIGSSTQDKPSLLGGHQPMMPPVPPLSTL